MPEVEELAFDADSWRHCHVWTPKSAQWPCSQAALAKLQKGRIAIGGLIQVTVVDNSVEQSAIIPRYDWKMSTIDEDLPLLFLKQLMDPKNNKLDDAIAETHTPVMQQHACVASTAACMLGFQRNSI